MFGSDKSSPPSVSPRNTTTSRNPMLSSASGGQAPDHLAGSSEAGDQHYEQTAGGQQQPSEPSKQSSQAQRSRRSKKSAVRACVSCRLRKVRCDSAQPQCGACAEQNRDCCYVLEPPRQRPTFARISELQRGKAEANAFIAALKQSNSQERERLLSLAVQDDGAVAIPADWWGESTTVVAGTVGDDGRASHKSSECPANVYKGDRGNGSLDNHATESQRGPDISGGHGASDSLSNSSDDEVDIGHFISVDDMGRPSIFGPSSALHNPSKSETDHMSPPRLHETRRREQQRSTLVANAALQRQLEYRLAQMPTIFGVSTELAQHLLNIHWNRQHHTFLLTYRPAIMRDLQSGGSYCSEFLLNAIFACSSKFSARPDVHGDQRNIDSAGRHFFEQCDKLLSQDNLLMKPNLCTVIGLLLLGSSHNARGEVSKAWLYTGYGLRMIYDLGLHLDPTRTTDDPEELEVRRRVFWGAFICDKLQSLYLGRPMAINLRDAHVSRDIVDTYEEQELFFPHQDARQGRLTSSGPMPLPVPLRSVSSFKQLCLLSRIMTKIINRFYAVRATLNHAQRSLHRVDKDLQRWKTALPAELDVDPFASASAAYESASTSPTSSLHPPNVFILHSMYYSLIILLHRPFISDSHLRSVTNSRWSWERCISAARCITGIALAYKNAYGLGSAPYVLGYGIYVGCTIHVRNAASSAEGEQRQQYLSLLKASLSCLDDLTPANPGISKPATIIRRLIETNKLDLTEEVTDFSMPFLDNPPLSFDLDAVMSMFSMNSTSNGLMDLSRDWQDGDMGPIPPDPLFGFMDDATSTLQHFTSPLSMSTFQGVVPNEDMTRANDREATTQSYRISP